MTSWYPGWQMTVAWLLTVAVAGVIYFVPVTRLVDSFSDHSATITAAKQRLAAQYRHARLSAVKLAGDPNKPYRIPDNATLEELRAEVMKHLKRLAPVLDLEALMAPADGIANRDEPQGGADHDAWGHTSKRPAARHGDHHGALDTVTIDRHASPASQS